MNRAIHIISISVLLSVSWYVLINYTKTYNTGQTSQETSTIKAEGYLYELDVKNSDVILGTSISSKLELPTMYNLAFDGRNAIDGLEIMKNKKELPRSILIETNKLGRPPSTDFQKSILSEPTKILKRSIPLSRKKYVPAGIIRQFVAPTRTSDERGTFREARCLRQIMHMKTEDTMTIRNNLDKLCAQIVSLSNKGVKIRLYTAPQHSSTCQSPRNLLIKRRITELLKDIDYYWIPSPKCSEYQTIDALHLRKESRLKFEKYLIQNIRLQN
jgi:hypothetical protein